VIKTSAFAVGIAAALLVGARSAGASAPSDVADLLSAAAVQADGRMILAGSTDEGDRTKPRRILLVRYQADGTPDVTFGSQGRVTTTVADYSTTAAAVAVQPDGRIVVGGVALVRYLPDGSLDAGFGAGGIVSLRVGIQHVAVQPDGKIVVAGGVDPGAPAIAVVDSSRTAATTAASAT
jgi:uncharacterized delta-60 repeat protein